MLKHYKWALIGFTSFICGCASTTQVGNLTGERKQFIVVPEKIWHAQADYSYQSFLKRAAKKSLLVKDPELTHTLNRLVPFTHSYRVESQKWKWEINATLNGDLNAHGFPGGKIILNTGLYWGLKLDQDELAFVIAHEMAHALREHNRERVSGGLFFGASTLITEGSPQMWVIESEADVIALDLMAQAGFNPEASIRFWNKFQHASEKRNHKGMSDAFLKHRIETLNAYLPKVQPKYEHALTQQPSNTKVG